MINDDCMVNYWNMRKYNLKKIWHVPHDKVPLSENGTPWESWHRPCGFKALQPAFQALPTHYKKMCAKNLGKEFAVTGLVDVIYFPHKYRKQFLSVSPIFSDVFLEVGLPTLCACLCPIQDLEILKAIYLWDQNRKNYQKVYSTNVDFVHPLKFSDPQCRAFALAQIQAHTQHLKGPQPMPR